MGSVPRRLRFREWAFVSIPSHHKSRGKVNLNLILMKSGKSRNLHPHDKKQTYACSRSGKLKLGQKLEARIDETPAPTDRAIVPLKEEALIEILGNIEPAGRFRRLLMPGGSEATGR